MQYTDANGTTQTITVRYQSFTVQTNFGISEIAEYPPTQTNLPVGIQFPDGSSYSFTYEATPGYPGSVTGRLASYTLPTGGTVQYQDSGGYGGIEIDGSIAGLTRSTSDGAVAYTRFNVSPVTTTSNGSSSTETTDASNNQTVLNEHIVRISR